MEKDYNKTGSGNINNHFEIDLWSNVLMDKTSDTETPNTGQHKYGADKVLGGHEASSLVKIKSSNDNVGREPHHLSINSDQNSNLLKDIGSKQIETTRKDSSSFRDTDMSKGVKHAYKDVLTQTKADLGDSLARNYDLPGDNIVNDGPCINKAYTSQGSSELDDVKSTYEKAPEQDTDKPKTDATKEARMKFKERSQAIEFLQRDDSDTMFDDMLLDHDGDFKLRTEDEVTDFENLEERSLLKPEVGEEQPKVDITDGVMLQKAARSFDFDDVREVVFIKQTSSSNLLERAPTLQSVRFRKITEERKESMGMLREASNDSTTSTCTDISTTDDRAMLTGKVNQHSYPDLASNVRLIHDEIRQIVPRQMSFSDEVRKQHSENFSKVLKEMKQLSEVEPFLCSF